MKNFKFIVPLLSVLMVLIFQNCKKDSEMFSGNYTSAEKGGWEASSRNETEPTTLGAQRTIPYKVDIVKQAYNNLYEPDINTLLANYRYVRFLPQSAEDVKILLESGFDFWDFPLDFDIVTLGESYQDPLLLNSDFTWQYAVVSAEAILPAVQHEVLEELSLIPEDSELAQEAFRVSGNEFEVPENFVGLPPLIGGKFDFELERGTGTGGGGGGGEGGGGGGGGGEGGGGECGCPTPDHMRKPSGCVQVYDNMLNGWDGVINVEVHTSRSQIFGAVFHREAETNNNGCWMINRKYYGNIHVWVKWENATVDVKTMDGQADLWGYSFPRRAYIGKYGGPNFNNISIKFNYTNAIGTKDFRNWVASTANNSVFEFASFLSGESIANGIPSNLKVLITPWGSGGNTGSAPMLDKIGFLQQFILFGSAGSLLKGLFGVILPTAGHLGLPLAVWLQAAAPDITFNINNAGNVNADDIRETMYHELAHALHFSQAGSNYWLDNIKYVIDNLGYGDGTAPGAGRCSVIESWGYQIGMYSAHLRYGINNSNLGGPVFNTWRNILERRLASVNSCGTPHIPYAWEWDLQDDNSLNPSNEVEHSDVTDRISGITNAQIFRPCLGIYCFKKLRIGA